MCRLVLSFFNSTRGWRRRRKEDERWLARIGHRDSFRRGRRFGKGESGIFRGDSMIGTRFVGRQWLGLLLVMGLLNFSASLRYRRKRYQ